MSKDQTFSKKEISQILSKASELQASKDLHEDEVGLTQSDLIHIAEEVGIEQEVLMQALESLNEPELADQQYQFLSGTSRIQHVFSIDKEITDEQWEDLVLEIRKETGGIGKTQRIGNTYEWEQRKQEFGYKHFSFTPKNGKTKIQMVSSWGPFRMFAGFLGFFFLFIITLITVKELSGKSLALMLAPIFGLGGFLLSRMFLKYYFKKEKEQLLRLTHRVSNKIRSWSASPAQPEIKIDEQDDFRDSKAKKTGPQKNRIS